MGTVVDITYEKDNQKVIDRAISYLINLEEKVDNFTKNFNSIKGKIEIDDEIEYLLKKNLYYKQISHKRFDIAIGTLTYLYGFPEGPFCVPDNRSIGHALKVISKSPYSIGNGFVERYDDVKLDMGAYAKGYIVDKVAKFLLNEGVESFILNAGGDLFASNRKKNRKWRIAIKNPERENDFLSIINLENKAVATSGNYERYFEKDGKRYIHIFNALDGSNANTYQSVSVIADTVEKADGLATVFFLMGLDEIEKVCKVENVSVLIYTLDSKKIKMCNWESFEDN
jgi:thiamine biosynthesis lipoprotein